MASCSQHGSQSSTSFYILMQQNSDSIKKKLSVGTIFTPSALEGQPVTGMIPLTSIEDVGNPSIEIYEGNVMEIKKALLVDLLLAVENRPRRVHVIKNDAWVEEASSLQSGDIVDILTKSDLMLAAGKIIDFVNYDQHGYVTTSYEIGIAKELQADFGAKCGFQNYKNTCILSIDRLRKSAAGDKKMYTYDQVSSKKEKNQHSKALHERGQRYYMLLEDVYDSVTSYMFQRGTLVRSFGERNNQGKLILLCEDEEKLSCIVLSTRENLKEILFQEFEIFLAVKDLVQRRQIILDEIWREEALLIQEGTMVDIKIGSDTYFEAGFVEFKGKLKDIRGCHFGINLKERIRLPGVQRDEKDGRVFVTIGQIRKSSGEWKDVKPKRQSRNKISPMVLGDGHPLNIGCRVRTILNNKLESGTLRWKGESKVFKYFKGSVMGGIELDNSVGTGSGTYKGKQYFPCVNKYGTFIEMNSIAHALDECPNLTFEDRVLVPLKEAEQKGTVKWIGKLKNTKKSSVFVGVELDKPLGDNSGAFKDFFFACKAKHGKLVPADRVKKLEKKEKTIPKSTEKVDKGMLQTSTDIYTDDSNQDEWYARDFKTPKPKSSAKNEEIHQWVKKNLDLELGDEVFLPGDEKVELGQIRWIGYLPKEPTRDIHAGVQFYNQITQGDGTFRGKCLFPCEMGYGSFLPIFSFLKSDCLPVSDKIKYETPMPQPGVRDSEVQLWVFENLKLTKEDEVFVFKAGEADMMKGKLKWIGHLPDAHETSKKIYAGVELDKPEGNCEGFYKGKRFFTCRYKHGIFVQVDEILKASDMLDDKSVMPPVGARDYEIEKWVRDNQRLEKGEEVLVCKDGEAELLKGTLKWLGYLPDAKETIYAGVELDKRKGNSDRIYSTQTLFTCKHGYGIFVPVGEILKASEMMDEDIPELENQANDAYESLSKTSRESVEKSVHGETVEMKNHWREVEKDHNGMGETDNGYRIQQLKDAQTAKHKSDSLDYSNENIYNEKPGTTIKLHGDTSDIRCINNESTVKHTNETMIGKQMDSLYYDARSNFENKKQKVISDDQQATYEKEVKSTQPPRLENISDNEMLYHCRGLEVGVAVEVAQKYPLYGTVRWMGKRISPGREDEYIAGIEAEEDYPGGTDGTFLKQRMFSCLPKRALFVRVTQCKRDTRFEEVPVSMPFGHRDTPDVEGYCEVPDFTKGVQNYCGTFKGIQGHHNSCYMDSTLFAMFFATEAFDQIFFREKQKGDSDTFEAVKNTLKHGIVNPLRKSGYVRADKVIKLRALLDQHGSVKGITNEEKDPEEFLNSLMNEVLQARPFIKLDSGQTSNMFQLFCEKDDDLPIPNVQQIVEQSFLQSGIKLAEVPKCLILQMPRFGKDYKLYQQIIPSLKLDITNILEGSHRLCVVCGNMAEVECPSCYKGFSKACISDITYCREDYTMAHLHQKRKGHVPKDLHVKKQYRDRAEPHELYLTAVVCIETSHYVSFVKCDKTWIFFDSMADRKGEANGYNIPEIKECPELVDWLKPTDENIQRLLNTKPRDLPPSVRRVLGDAYLCLYQQSPDDMLYA